MGELRILCSTGDQKIQWDPQSEDEVEVAELSFDRLKAKGYKAYEVEKTGEKGKEITKFKKKAGMIIMAPVIAGG